MRKIVDQIDSAVKTAQAKILTCADMNGKLLTAGACVPDTRTRTEFGSMYTKLSQAQKKLNPFKSFRTEFNQWVKDKEAILDITETLRRADLKLEQVYDMTARANESQVSHKVVTSAEVLVATARQSLGSICSVVEQELNQASGPIKVQWIGIKARLQQSQKKVNDVNKTLEHQIEAVIFITPPSG
jgi:uncharacterized phage infection (PIP) family protein YhgE